MKEVLTFYSNENIWFGIPDGEGRFLNAEEVKEIQEKLEKFRKK